MKGYHSAGLIVIAADGAGLTLRNVTVKENNRHSLGGAYYTIGDVHYVQEGDELIPASQTEFAGDVTFGYRHSSLPEYIQEKTLGRYPAEETICISLEMLRSGKDEKITELLVKVTDFKKVVVNAISEEDLKVFAAAFYRAVSQGKTPAVYTVRELLKVEGDTPQQALKRSAEISLALASVIENLQTEPRFVVAKGGITSSDIGTRALKVEKALAAGQIEPGVPVWKTDENSRFPQMPYVIFPGNDDFQRKSVKSNQS